MISCPKVLGATVGVEVGLGLGDGLAVAHRGRVAAAANGWDAKMDRIIGSVCRGWTALRTVQWYFGDARNTYIHRAWIRVVSRTGPFHALTLEYPCT